MFQTVENLQSAKKNLRGMVNSSLERMEIQFEEYDSLFKSINASFSEFDELRGLAKEGGTILDGINEHVLSQMQQRLVP